MIFKIIRFLIKGIFKYVLPILFTSFIIYEWPNLNANQARILMSINVLLIVRIENCFAFYRFYKQKSRFEYEMTIFLATVKVVNSFQAQSATGSIYIIICEWVFDLFLLCNALCYALSFCIIIIFVLIVIFGLIRGDFPIVNRGLSPEELLKLTRKPWIEYQVPQQEDCPICLCQLEQMEIIVQLPKCNHYFHDTCIDEWLNAKPLCPSCRNNVRMALLND
ncbi:unnamed protein product [Paramecium primaurelia]|uniref:RING-type domain-containing protein n=2 Tax=Paramecium TaxID=5884 RepID=A0A8S1VJR0_9CILI|nr:unnamed protein product [Paramecium primaurelia]CAD8175979.1 unnamed protein product [Paramecium pentaurelia]